MAFLQVSVCFKLFSMHYDIRIANREIKIKRCTRCVMPETWAGIIFDDDGVCNICREAEKKVRLYH